MTYEYTINLSAEDVEACRKDRKLREATINRAKQSAREQSANVFSISGPNGPLVWGGARKVPR